MRGYTKEDVEQHCQHFGQLQAAVNVKVRDFPSIDQAVDRFGCSEVTAERALEFALEMHTEEFWENAGEEAVYYLGPCKVYSEGRCGGWLVVAPDMGRNMVTTSPLLGDVEGWDAITLNKWALFERCIKQNIEWLCGWEQVSASIAANEWAVDQTAIEGMMAVAVEV